MTFRDLVDLSVGNLWRVKLRAALTTAGVVIAIATLVAMLSFAAGNHRYVTDMYEELGLFTRMNVFPRSGDHASDTTAAAMLNAKAVDELSRIPGVKLAYPFVDFDVTVALADTQFSSTARALPAAAIENPIYSTLLGGARFSSDEAREAIVTSEFIAQSGIGDVDSLVGSRLVISRRVTSVDSALAGMMGDPAAELMILMREVRVDSLSAPAYQRRVIRRELRDRARRFFDGLMNHQVTLADTLVITAVGEEPKEYRLSVAPIVVPERTARRLSESGFALGSDPTDLLAAMQSGEIFGSGDSAEGNTYPRVTLDLEPRASASAVKDSVEALGFRAFSFADQFEEIQRFFVYFYLGLGVLGLIALVTAALGIVNTMVMSISERRREIGILKSLGADERAIRLAFLTESGAIGAMGAAVGIALGWLGTRIASIAVRVFMERQEMPLFEPFALPPWLVLLALAFGILVSLLAGSYPAGRAARVDPVEALRGE